MSADDVGLRHLRWGRNSAGEVRLERLECRQLGQRVGPVLGTGRRHVDERHAISEPKCGGESRWRRRTAPEPDAPELPLIVDFEVHVTVERAFEVWTTRAGMWWPKGHTISGDPDSVVFEPHVGGRILEGGRDGSEYVWGEITDWAAPRRLRFRWHLFFDPAQATDVSLTFEQVGAVTRIRLEQTGFAALGAAGLQRREGNTRGWSAVTTAFASGLTTDDTPRR